MMDHDIDLEFELHAYVDGDLDEESMSRVEQYLRSNSEAAARVREYLQQKETLRALARSEMDLEDSTEIRELSRRLARRLRPVGRWGWQRSVVAAALLAAGWLGHMLYDPLINGPAFTEEAVQAHLLTAVDPTEIMPISQERLEKLFSRVGIDARLPNLRPFGFDPIGAELVPSDEGILLHVPYRDANDTTISYFLIYDPDVAEVPRHILHRKGVTLAYWQHAHERFAVAAPLSDDEISSIAGYLDSFEAID